jgi:hypothetical protein
MYSVCFKKDLAKRFHPSKFDIQYSIFCGSLCRPAAKAASLVLEKPYHFGVVSYKVSVVKKREPA